MVFRLDEGETMKPLHRAMISETEIRDQIKTFIGQWRLGNADLRRAFQTEEAIEESIRHMVATDEIWMNDKYQVNRREGEEGLVHLSIKRRDKKALPDWRDFQAIKNQLIGPECEAVELFPAESRLVDTANQYHLWGVRTPGFRFPFGFNDGRMVTDEPLGKSVQRPFIEV